MYNVLHLASMAAGHQWQIRRSWLAWQQHVLRARLQRDTVLPPPPQAHAACQISLFDCAQTPKPTLSHDQIDRGTQHCASPEHAVTAHASAQTGESAQAAFMIQHTDSQALQRSSCGSSIQQAGHQLSGAAQAAQHTKIKDTASPVAEAPANSVAVSPEPVLPVPCTAAHEEQSRQPLVPMSPLGKVTVSGDADACSACAGCGSRALHNRGPLEELLQADGDSEASCSKRSSPGTLQGAHNKPGAASNKQQRHAPSACQDNDAPDQLRVPSGREGASGTSEATIATETMQVASERQCVHSREHSASFCRSPAASQQPQFYKAALANVAEQPKTAQALVPQPDKPTIQAKQRPNSAAGLRLASRARAQARNSSANMLHSRVGNLAAASDEQSRHQSNAGRPYTAQGKRPNQPASAPGSQIASQQV